jgi:hypothetical protein
MTLRVERPSEWVDLDDHQRRIRALEAVCCGGGGTGFEEAALIRDRAGWWYGCGDGSAVDGSTVRNYGQVGSDGEFVNNGDAEDCVPGTTGPDGTGGWTLAQDLGSFQGCRKNYCAGGGYNDSPYIDPLGLSLDMANDFTVNMWVTFEDFSAFCNVPPTVDTYETSVAFGERNQGSGFTRQLLIYVPGLAQATGNPPPDPILHACIASGGGSHVDISAGIMVIGLEYMVTVTWEAATNTFTMYVNGGVVSSGVEASGTTTFGTLQIGAANTGDSFSNYSTWAGLLDEVGVWDTECLTAGDVAILFTAGVPPDPTTAEDMDSSTATCGQPLCADGTGGATWGNPCNDTGVFVMPGSPTAQDIVDALIAMGLVTQ